MQVCPIKLQVFTIVAISAFATMACNRAPDPLGNLQITPASWTPPQTKIDPNYVEATRRLLGNGLADPRNGTFCLVRSKQEGTTKGNAEVERYGWESSDHRWLNGLDGVVSPVTGQIEPAKLESAVEALIAKSTPRRFSRTHSDLSPATAAVLLVAGKAKLAESIPPQDFQGSSPENSPCDYLAARYQAMADAALEQNEDEAGAAASANWIKVLKVQESLQKQASRDVRPEFQNNSHDLEHAEKLYGDFQRRLAEKKAQNFDPKSVEKLDKKTRIAKLIEALDTAKPPVNNPGGAMWLGDPIVQALAAEGGDAIPPLIDAVENDARLSRAVARRTFGETSPGQPIPVRSAEWTAIQMIWPSAVRYADSGGSPIPSALRAAWTKEGSIPESQRQLNILEDDHADPRLWIEAATNLVKPANEIIVGASSMTPPAKAPMTGEDLRASKGAEISSVMASRATQMLAPTDRTSQGVFGAANALRMAHLSYRWSRPASLSSLQEICRSVVAQLDTFSHEGSLKEILADPFGIAIADRLTLNDSRAAQDYAAFVPFAKPEMWFIRPGFFQPFWTAPTDPQIRQIGSRYMEGWLKNIASPDTKVWRNSLDSALGTLPSSPLIQFRPYRDLLIHAIALETPGGQTEVIQLGSRKVVAVKINGQTITHWNVPPDSEAALSPGKKDDFSVGDYAAQGLSQFVKGIPPFPAVGSRAEKDRARKAIAAWLNDDSRDWEAVAKASPFYSMSQD